MAIAPDGSYHVAWFTDGAARKGLFYARADIGDAPYCPAARRCRPPNRQPSRPYLLANGSALHLVWKEFDGDKVAVRWQVSHDSGRHWSAAPHRRRDRRTPPTILCWSPTGSAPTCRG